MLVNGKAVFQPHFQWNSHKYQRHQNFISYLANVAQMCNYSASIFIDILKVNITSNQRYESFLEPCVFWRLVNSDIPHKPVQSSLN